MLEFCVLCVCNGSMFNGVTCPRGPFPLSNVSYFSGTIGDLGENTFTSNSRSDPSVEVGFSSWNALPRSGPPRGMLNFEVSYDLGPLCRPTLNPRT